MENTESDISTNDAKVPVLSVLYGPDAGRHFPLEKSLITLGRGEDRDIQFQDRAMSRMHCDILQEKGVLIIRDTGSQNGIKVNGRLTMEHRLSDGDQIDIGSTRLVIRIPQKERNNP